MPCFTGSPDNQLSECLVGEVQLSIAKRSLRGLRVAIHNNEVSFPSQVPRFDCQSRPDIQWRLAELYFIHNWTCPELGERYGVTMERVRQLIFNWVQRAIVLGYVQEIPASTGCFANPYVPKEGVAAAVNDCLLPDPGSVAQGCKSIAPAQTAMSVKKANNAIPKPMRTLLLYEDEDRCPLLRTTLAGEGCDVDEAPFDRQAPASPAAGYGIVLFSVHRPNSRLLEVLRAWHDAAPNTSLVVVSDRTAPANRVAMLEAGINAYLTEPVRVAELAAHVRSALRRFRTQDAPLNSLYYGTSVIDLNSHLIRTGHRLIHLTQTECRILEHLAEHPNQTVFCGDLVKALWGADPRKGSHSLRSFIRQLRRKLEPDPANPRYLVTDATKGYRLENPALEGPPALARL